MKSPALLLMPVLLAGCDTQALLAENPVERAATCGVVAAAQARVEAPVGKPLPLEAQGEVLRPALLAGAAGEEFDGEAAEAVVKRMPVLAESVTQGDNWKELAPACAAAYPAAPAAPALPDDALAAALGCDQLGRFLKTALGASGDYEEPLLEYGVVERTLDSRIAPLLARRGLASEDAQAKEKRKALGAFAKLGNPVTVMNACVVKYAASPSSSPRA